MSEEEPLILLKKLRISSKTRVYFCGLDRRLSKGNCFASSGRTEIIIGFRRVDLTNPIGRSWASAHPTWTGSAASAKNWMASVVIFIIKELGYPLGSLFGRVSSIFYKWPTNQYKRSLELKWRVIRWCDFFINIIKSRIHKIVWFCQITFWYGPRIRLTCICFLGSLKTTNPAVSEMRIRSGSKTCWRPSRFSTIIKRLH